MLYVKGKTMFGYILGDTQEKEYSKFIPKRVLVNKANVEEIFGADWLAGNKDFLILTNAQANSYEVVKTLISNISCVGLYDVVISKVGMSGNTYLFRGEVNDSNSSSSGYIEIELLTTGTALISVTFSDEYSEFVRHKDMGLARFAYMGADEHFPYYNYYDTYSNPVRLVEELSKVCKCL